jgi:SAM-dependent methyltransferase
MGVRNQGFAAAALRPWLRRIPVRVKRGLRGVVQKLPSPAQQRLGITIGHQRPPRHVRWGNLRRTTPFSRTWGYDRGTPIDRVYIEEFLAAHASDVQGECLEVLNADYTRRFGHNRVTASDVLDINPANSAATVVADLGETDSLPARRFDCVIFTQTLHLVPDMQTALHNVWRALRRGGVLLLTVPALGRHDSQQGFDRDRWRLTRPGLEWLLSTLSDATSETTTYGNLLSCSAFLYGLAAQELRPEELRISDPEFPLVVAARVRKA